MSGKGATPSQKQRYYVLWSVFCNLKLYFYFLLFFVFVACDGFTPPSSSQSSSSKQPDSSLFENALDYQTASSGPFTRETKKVGSFFIIRFSLKNQTISRHNFLTLLADEKQHGKIFRNMVNASIANLPKVKTPQKSYMLWSPVINSETKDMPFYFALTIKDGFSENLSNTYNPQFKHCNPQPDNLGNSYDYDNRFLNLYQAAIKKEDKFQTVDKNWHHAGFSFAAVAFKGGQPYNSQQIMISPCPLDSSINDNKNKPLVDLFRFATFLEQSAPKPAQRLMHSFWYAVGKTALKMFDGKTVKDFDNMAHKKLFLNAHGANIHYLHFRIETEALPGHYFHYDLAGDIGKKLEDKELSHTFYQSIFP